MKIAHSAFRHGIAESAILHAWRNRVRIVEYEYQGDTRSLVIDADYVARCLELVVVTADEPSKIVHTQLLREKFYEYLR